MDKLLADYDQWLRAEKNLAPTSRDVYVNCNRIFLTDIGKQPSEITRNDIVNWRLAKLENENYDPRTLNKYMSAIRSMSHYLRFAKVIDDTTFLNISSINRFPESQRIPRYITREQVEALFKQCNLKRPIGWRDLVLLFFLYRAALRISEAHSLNVEDIADNYSTIRIIGKGDKEAIVPIDGNNFKEALRVWVEEKRPLVAHPDENALLVSTKHTTGWRVDVRNLKERVYVLGRRAGLPDWFSSHSLRHSRATHLLDAGMELRYIQELLRHSSIESTTIYTYVSSDALKRELALYSPGEEVDL